MIKISNLDFSYSKSEEKILLDINTDFQKGRVKGILGNNGAGKSTLIKCINRTFEFTNGEILINGKAVENFTKKEMAQEIAYISQNERPTHSLVFDTVLLGRKPYIKWEPTQEDKEIVVEILNKLEIVELSMRFCDELSGGEFQKVLLARALAQKPKFLLLDEPTSNLDPKNQMEMMEAINEISNKENIGVVVVLHDLNLAIKYCTDFVFLKAGIIQAQGGREVFTEKIIKDVYNIDVEIIDYKERPVVVQV